MVCLLKYSLRLLTLFTQLTKNWVTLHSWEYHLKVQPTFADNIHTANKKLGYTTLMGVPLKVQPKFAEIIHTANQKLGYTALMGVPP